MARPPRIVRYRYTRTAPDKTVETGGKTSGYDRYSISSLAAGAERFAHIVRQHRPVENNLRWSLDVSFCEDASKIRKNNAPEWHVILCVPLRLTKN